MDANTGSTDGTKSTKSALKERIEKRTLEIIAHQKKQGWWNFDPKISDAHKASLEADFKIAAMVDAIVEVLEDFDRQLKELQVEQTFLVKKIQDMQHPLQNEGKSDSIGGAA